MNNREIRQLFTSFFAERGHRHVPSSSLIPPPEERTLLFTNAGMNQMKPYFMGLATPPATRMTSIQKCFRTGDIEEVGDVRHLTFFEMLGNFSVGDYFKGDPEGREGAIPWAWELLTAAQPKGLGLNRDCIWATIFLDDDEAFEIWRKVGLPAERIVRFGEKENYWFMGPVGPCGPNTEINYDFGPDQGCGRPDCAPNCENLMPDGSGPCDRFIEIWNLVFMTLFQAEDGSRRPLPQRNVDTGGGLERWLMPLLWEAKTDWQGRPKAWTRPPTLFDSDLFQPVIAKVSELAGMAYGEASVQEQRAMRVVADHARGATFLIGDGVTPSNEGRGYVLRRLIRRGTSFGQRLNPGSQFLEETAATVIEHMAAEHENLREQRDFILRTLRSEETRFFETLTTGRAQLEEFKRESDDMEVTGSRVFQLWDTYGFPPELTLELLSEDGYAVNDPETFERLMEEQRARSRAAGQFEADGERLQTYAELSLPHTEFVGYERTRTFAHVSAILIDGTTVVRTLTPALSTGHRVEIVLTQTSFYPEGGGQVGDRGEIVWPEGHFIVDDAQAVGEGGVIAHIGRLEAGSISAGDPVEARVNEDLRADTMRNHTATHVQHAALRQVLGSHVRQAGSLVTPERLRFDFTHLEALTADELRRVELLANKTVRENITVTVDYMSYEEALAAGALAFFGDKYADTVRVVGVCDLEADRCFSKELCGGTHVHASGDIGAIVITGEASIGAGLRRLEAVTGRVAAERARQNEETLSRLGLALQAAPSEVEPRVAALKDQVADLERSLRAIERRMARGESDAIADSATRVGETALIASRVGEVPNVDFLRDLGDGLKTRLGSAVILLAGTVEGKPSFLAMATPDVAKKCPAGDVVRVAAKEAGGGGGGRPELAQGGGTDVSKIDAALAAGKQLMEERLQAGI
jgi:alanyl-tRNA synthetase